MTRMMTLEKEYLIVATAHIEKRIMAGDDEEAEQKFLDLVNQEKLDEIFEDGLSIEVNDVVPDETNQER